jgi:carbon-monoxide dehydrogenase large subunit
VTITEERTEAPAPEVGKARRRKEDQRLITGRTRWTDNMQLPGMLHLAMVRSPFAHANITAIDTSAAQAADGVVLVVTGEDVKDVQGVIANAWPITADQKAPTHLPVAIGRVACAGEIVAVVVARTARAARDAAELVDVDYEVLPPVLDLKEAAADTVLAHPDLGTNKSAFWKLDSAEQGSGGNVDEAIEKARGDGIVIEREYRQQRLIPAFMEPRSVVVDPTDEQMTVWSSTQIPHILRFLIAATMGISEAKVRVIAPDVGGGFGGKLQTVICSPVGSHTVERGSMNAGMSRCWRNSRSRTMPSSRALAISSSTSVPEPCAAESRVHTAEVLVPRSGCASTSSLTASLRSRTAGSSS